MASFSFHVDRQRITVESHHAVAGSMKYLDAVFDFSGDWEGYTKTVTFIRGDMMANHILKNDRIDKEDDLQFGEPGPWIVGVTGVHANGSRITTSPVKVTINRETPHDGTEPTPEEQTLYQQAVAMAADAKAAAEQTKGAVDAAEESARTAAEEARGAKTAAQSAGTHAAQALEAAQSAEAQAAQAKQEAGAAKSKAAAAETSAANAQTAAASALAGSSAAQAQAASADQKAGQAQTAASSAQAEAQALGVRVAALEERPAGEVSAESITEALGYTPADAEEVGELRDDIAELSSVIEDENAYDESLAVNGMSMSTDGGWINQSPNFWITSDARHKTPINAGASKIILSHIGYKVCFWDESQTFVSTNVSKLNEYDIPLNARYFIVQFQSSIVPYLTDVKIVFDNTTKSVKGSSLSDNSVSSDKMLTEIQYAIDLEVFRNQPAFPAHSYVGERICIYNPVGYTDFGNAVKMSQGGAVYGDELFSFTETGLISVSDMANTEYRGKGTVVGADNLPHCNTVFFGYEKYVDSDEYPLVYVSAYNAPNTPKGTLYALRLQTSDHKTWTATVVQTISVGFVDDPIWTDGASDIRPYGSFLYDDVSNKMYVYTLLDKTHVTRFFVFDMPNVDTGNIVLQKSDIIDQFDTEYIRFPQDACMNGGKIYISSGLADTDTHIYCVNPVSKKIVTDVNLKNIGINIEPETIDVYRGKLWMGNYLHAYRMDF